MSNIEKCDVEISISNTGYSSYEEVELAIENYEQYYGEADATTGEDIKGFGFKAIFKCSGVCVNSDGLGKLKSGGCFFSTIKKRHNASLWGVCLHESQK